MKKLFFVAILVVTVACERDETVVKENSQNTIKLSKTYEETLSKTDSDTLRVKNISPAAGVQEEIIEDVDPKDIVPPRR